MPCIGILGIKIYHTQLPHDLFNMIYKNQNWFLGELNMDLFSHLELSYYNKFTGRHVYRNIKFNIYTITYKDVELYFYLEKNTDGYIYFIDEAINSRTCISCEKNEGFNEFIETLENIGIEDRCSEAGFFVLEE